LLITLFHLVILNRKRNILVKTYMPEMEQPSLFDFD
jgi:hypothetical protein